MTVVTRDQASYRMLYSDMYSGVLH